MKFRFSLELTIKSEDEAQALAKAEMIKENVEEIFEMVTESRLEEGSLRQLEENEI